METVARASQRFLFVRGEVDLSCALQASTYCLLSALTWSKLPTTYRLIVVAPHTRISIEMGDRNCYSQEQRSHTNANADSDISGGRMAPVFLDLRDVRVQDCARRISFPIANDEVVVARLGYVTFFLGAILKSDRGLCLGSDSKFNDLNLDLFGRCRLRVVLLV
jgi:hypothetical protein